MTQSAHHPEQNRTRLGLVFLVVGIILLLWSWGHWIYRASGPSEAESSLAEHVTAANPDVVRAARLSPLILLVGLLLVLGFLVGSYAMIRTWRRYRALAEDRRPKPTSAEDVWTMHKLQNHDDEEGS